MRKADGGYDECSKAKAGPGRATLLCTLENEGASGSPRDEQGCLP